MTYIDTVNEEIEEIYKNVLDKCADEVMRSRTHNITDSSSGQDILRLAQLNMSINEIIRLMYARMGAKAAVNDKLSREYDTNPEKETLPQNYHTGNAKSAAPRDYLDQFIDDFPF